MFPETTGNKAFRALTLWPVPPNLPPKTLDSGLGPGMLNVNRHNAFHYSKDLFHSPPEEWMDIRGKIPGLQGPNPQSGKLPLSHSYQTSLRCLGPFLISTDKCRVNGTVRCISQVQGKNRFCYFKAPTNHLNYLSPFECVFKPHYKIVFL